MRHYTSIRNFLLCLSFFISLLCAEFAVASDLKFNNKSLDSLCIYEAKPGIPVTLKHCGLSAPNQNRHVIKGNAYLSNQGYIGYYYTIDEQSNGAIPLQAYSYYRVVGQIGGRQIVQTVNNTGGTGDFTGLYSIDRPDDMHMIVNPIALGDRCNGGVVRAKIENGTVQYQQNITGFMLYSLIQKNNPSSPQLTPYTDLEDCAVCCVAKAGYQVVLQKGSVSQSRLMHIELGKALNQLSNNNQGQYQNCLNKILVSIQQSNGRIIYPNQFTKIADLFVSQCKSN